MTRVRGIARVCAATTSAALAAVLLTGCVPDVGDLLGNALEEAIESGSGGEIDVELGRESCMPEWVAVPMGDVVFAQKLATSEGVVCVTGWMVAEGSAVAPSQSLPAVADGDQLGGLATMMGGLLASQMGGSMGGLLGSSLTGDLDDLAAQFEEEGGQIEVFGDDGSVLIVVTSEGADANQTQIAMGLACEGAC